MSNWASDDWLFGWDITPGIVSVWADRSGRALIWQRYSQDKVRCVEERFRPWVFAATLDDLHHLGPALVQSSTLYPYAHPYKDKHRDKDENKDKGKGGATFSYCALNGPPESLRYLISAHDGYALQRAILLGAQKRLGKSVKHLRDLSQDYYSVGAVEQYLMLTGRVYFRGMTYGDLHRLQFDLETTSLSPKLGRIFMVAVRDNLGLETVLEAPSEADEATLISDLCELIEKRDPDVLENHNLFGFDLPFLEGRAAALGVPLLLGRSKEAPFLEHFDEPGRWGRGRRTCYNLAGRELIDTLDAVRYHRASSAAGSSTQQSSGLKAAARYFGVAAPDRTYIAGPEIYTTYQRDPERVRRYAFDDVREVDGLSQRLMGAPFALAGMAPRRYTRLASAGPATGILEPMLVRAYLRSGSALPRNAAQGDALLPPHQGGATTLYAAGVARQVVKADIASMYPSIMRTFGIGPKCDPLNVLLYLVDRLTDLRLYHKHEASVFSDTTNATNITGATTANTTHQQHQALQSAMKLLINAAYGYMGAGQMALFADRQAADTVTRRGREILSQVVKELHHRGLVLLEADTDGVFFSVPEEKGWTEEMERACVTEVASTLPKGLKLEYEGRYQAMLSHEVKNYALLTYQGQLIVRGNAFQSSRMEPFGEKFLHSALHYTLLGDCQGLQQLYLETVAALRTRKFTPFEVAIVARLRKTSEEYAQSRPQRREAQYDALLTAGRTHWRTGERVRFYRAEGGATVWLPDVPENDMARADELHFEQKGLVSVDMSMSGVLPKYDVKHYLGVLHTSYVSRLRKAFAPADFEQIFRIAGQAGLFDQPISAIQPHWI